METACPAAVRVENGPLCAFGTSEITTKESRKVIKGFNLQIEIRNVSFGRIRYCH